MVPLSPDDVPPGSYVRYIKTQGWFSVIGVFDMAITVIDEYGRPLRIHFDDLIKYNEISRDGGKTWQKCEKEAK
jgi:hypothetical protein